MNVKTIDYFKQIFKENLINFNWEQDPDLSATYFQKCLDALKDKNIIDLQPLNKGGYGIYYFRFNDWNGKFIIIHNDNKFTIQAYKCDVKNKFQLFFDTLKPF